MKKVIVSIVILAVVIIIAFTNTYTSSPSLTTENGYKEFTENKPVCYGLDILLNRQATYADAPGISFCLGFLK